MELIDQAIADVDAWRTDDLRVVRCRRPLLGSGKAVSTAEMRRKADLHDVA